MAQEKKRNGHTLSTVRSGTDQTEVQTEPNLQVLGSVLCEGRPDPYLQVQGPGVKWTRPEG